MENEVTINGKIISKFEFNHYYNNEQFYLTYVSVYRQSGTEDTIPIIVSEKLINPGINYINTYVSIKGKYQSYNNHKNSHVELYVFVNSIDFDYENCDINQIVLHGIICKQPTFRTTPLGREISDIIIAVPRNSGKTDYIPCICWGRNAHYVSKLSIGDQVQIQGRIQSRNYEKITEGVSKIKTAYEVSVINIFK